MPAHSPIRQELAAVLRLALPVVLSQLGVMLMGVVDTVMLGHDSAEALAAGALGHIVSVSLLMLGTGILAALDPLVSQAHGAGDRAAVAGHFCRGLVLASLLAIPFTAAHFYLRPVFTAFGEPAEVIAGADAYVRALASGVLPFLLVAALRQTLQAMSLVRPALVAVVAGNVVNLVGNWLLIFGHAGFPRLGITGSALSTAIARWLMLLVLAVASHRHWRPLLTARRRDLMALVPYRLLLRLGLPIGIHGVLELFLFAVIALLVGKLGVAQLAGHQIAINLASLSFMVPLGIAGAAATRVGNAVGRGDAAGAQRAAGVCYALGVGVMLVFAFLFAAFPHVLPALYSRDPAVIAAAAALIPIAAAFQVFDGAQVVGTGILRGTADTAVPAAIALIGFWLVGLPAAWWLAFPGGYGAAGMWWGITLGLAALATLLSLRILARFRRSLGRVEP
jgi:MATE family multidrug resistance protein